MAQITQRAQEQNTEREIEGILTEEYNIKKELAFRRNSNQNRQRHTSMTNDTFLALKEAIVSGSNFQTSGGVVPSKAVKCQFK
jgi:hypothetical protein